MLNLLAASYGPVSDIEIVWTLIAGLGLIFCATNLVDAIHDLQIVGAKRLDLASRILVKNHMINEAIRTLILTMFLVIGIIAMTIQEQSPLVEIPLKFVIYGAIIQWTFILSSALLVFKSILEYMERRRLRLLLEGEQENG